MVGAEKVVEPVLSSRRTEKACSVTTEKVAIPAIATFLSILYCLASNKGDRMSTKRSVVLVLLLLCSFIATTNAQWRPITPDEEAFVQTVEAKVRQVLLDAANGMGGKWEIKIETDKFQRYELDEGQHGGRPHEVRLMLTMGYQPSEAEREVMEKRINDHGERTSRYDPIPDELMRVSPEFEWQIYVSTVVNYYGFLPRTKNGVVSLGYQTNVPGTFFSAVRWKELGTGAPIHTLYLGDLKWERRKGEQYVVENFSTVTNCRNVRTILCEVHSNEKVAEAFIKKLNVTALNDLVRTH